MGFMDKAKKMAEQAQSKLDEVQKNFNEKQSGEGQGDAPAVKYDDHGRPVNEPAAAPPAPEAAAVPTPDPAAAPPTDAAPSGEPAKVQGDPLLDEDPAPPAPPAPPSGGKPGMTSGDPLG